MFLGYTRVSTIEQASRERVSLDEQQRVIKGIAMSRGVKPFDLAMYSDPGVSGSVPLAERPSGAKLLEDMKRGDIVCASKLDRMFRSAIDALATSEKMKKMGVGLILFDMGSDPVTGDGMAKCFFTMAAAFAELERTRINERTQEGRKGKKAKGGHVGGSAPYGFRVVGEGKEARLEPDPEEFDIRKMIVDMAKKRPYGNITSELRMMGVQNRSGALISWYQVKRVVAHAKTTGELRA